MFTGVVHRFLHDRGFGFIAPDDPAILPSDFPGENVFVHINELRRAGIDVLDKGDQVEFEIVKGRGDKYEARKIRLLTTDPAAPVRYGAGPTPK